MATKFVIWVILSYGLTNIMVFGKIFDGLRLAIKRWSESKLFLHSLGKFLNGMLSCPLCFSTWGGFFLSLTVYSPMHMTLGVPLYFSWFFDGVLSSGGVWMIHAIIEYFEENRINFNNNQIL